MPFFLGIIRFAVRGFLSNPSALYLFLILGGVYLFAYVLKCFGQVGKQ